MSDSFNLNTIKQYKRSSKLFFAKHELKSEAAMAIFDKNFDRKISKSEYEAVSKQEYEKCLSQLQSEMGQDAELHNYDDIKDFFDDGFISFEELDGLVNEYGLKNKNLDEVKTLKDVTQMSDEEVMAELSEYGIEESSGDIRKILNEVRDERSNYDKNSNVVDGHIGTFVQAKENAMCTVLSVLETMSDEQIKQMYETKTDENGKVYYEITFPQDKLSGQSVIVTQEEIDNMAIKIRQEDGSEKEILNFSTGDADVTMFEMAFVKRFGTDTFENGGEIEISRQIFNSPDEGKFVRNINLENLENLENLPQNTTISMLYNKEFFEKGVSMVPFELQDGRTCSFSSGKLILSDGTEINQNHALSVKGYDKNSKELIVSGNSFNSSSELRIPAELLKYFAMALPEDFS